ncbi:MAG: glucuronate isomerase [Lachnospiraceae bacterium]|nr:glucuronate isomerase [Lachnospiraceae bacterium]
MKKEFLGNDFLLENDTAERLYFEYSEQLPIIDYHCHIDAKDIYEDRRFNDICELWLGGYDGSGRLAGDHYKWRLMRANGIEEKYITGDGDPVQKFIRFVKTLSKAIGNPMYHWCALELKNYFGITDRLDIPNTAKIMNRCNDLLKNDPALSARGIIMKSNVEFIGTTDDPTDDLKWHKKIAEDKGITFKVCPSFRPDKALAVRDKGFRDHMDRLAGCTGKESLETAGDVLEALKTRLDDFVSCGCKAADHGLLYVPYNSIPMEECDRIYKKAMSKGEITDAEADGYTTRMLLELAKEYSRRGIVMEIHYSCARNVNKGRYETLGPDSGFDMIAASPGCNDLAKFMSELDETDELPKTVIFSLDPSDNARIDTLAGCFPGTDVAGKVQHGAAWWFNDSKAGIEEHLKSLAAYGILGNFIGMLTDSRSLLSYARHEYFRRIACNMIGSLVESGEYPDSEHDLKMIVEGISYYNAKRYFGI